MRLIPGAVSLLLVLGASLHAERTASGAGATSSAAHRPPAYQPLFVLRRPLFARPGMLLPVHSSPFSVPNVRGWYELDAHLVVSFRRSTSNGGGDISVSVNGRSACLITFSIRTQHRTRMIAWSTGELISGSSSGVATGSHLILEFRNLTQYQSVQQTGNELELGADGLGRSGIASVRLLPGSQIGETLVPPATLTAQLASPGSSPRRWKPFCVRYTISSAGLPALWVGLRSRYSRSLLPLGPPVRFLGGTLQRSSGCLWFLPMRLGVAGVTVYVAGKTGAGAVASTHFSVVEAPLQPKP